MTEARAQLTARVRIRSHFGGLLFAATFFASSQPSIASGLRAEIVNSNDHVIVSWPVSPLSEVLEMAETPGPWIAVTNLSTAVESNFFVGLPKTNDGALFRLNAPTSIPIFQFGAFYDLDYECAAIPAMAFGGAVHCNANIYLTPHTGITYRKSVTSVSNILLDAKQGNMVGGTAAVTNLYGWRACAERLSLAIGTNSWREIVEIPPPEENRDSDIGRERFFNKADMIILVSNNLVRVTSGRYNNFETTIQLQDFVATNGVFYNGRERKIVRVAEIDIGKFIVWKKDVLRNPISFPLVGGTARDITTIYVADFRPTNVTHQTGIRLRNANTLPAEGLTVASPHPVYILGHYNCPNAVYLGTTNTTTTAPAAVIADAVTILSSAWADYGGANIALGSRVPTATTVNAALVSGIVQTSTNKGYSGGIESYLRLLEDWNTRTLTYNGSMAMLYESRYAVAPWNVIGIYYNPPIRKWGFDSNFLHPARLPPGTPMVSRVAGN